MRKVAQITAHIIVLLCTVHLCDILLQNICDTYFFGQITFSYKKSTLVLVIHDVIGFGISLGDIGT